MGNRVLIVLVVIIILLAVVAVVLGANRKDKKQENAEVKGGKTGMAPFLDRAFGWMSPKFDLADLTVSGATLNQEKRTVSLSAEQQVTFTVKPKPGAGPNDCRSLTLALVSPKVTGPGAEVVKVVTATLNPPVPKDVKAPKEEKPLFPVPPPDKDDEVPDVKLDTPKKYDECAIAVFSGGATVVLKAMRTCTLEIR